MHKKLIRFALLIAEVAGGPGSQFEEAAVA